MNEAEYQIGFLVAHLLQKGLDVLDIADGLATVLHKVEELAEEVTEEMAEEIRIMATFDEIIEASFGGDEDEA